MENIIKKLRKFSFKFPIDGAIIIAYSVYLNLNVIWTFDIIPFQRSRNDPESQTTFDQI